LWRVVLIGMICSTTTEITQWIFRIGLFELDDILNNTIGCLLGCLLFICVMPCYNKRGIRERHHEKVIKQ
jgi:glycopeptide antibiotics resistance protein